MRYIRNNLHTYMYSKYETRNSIHGRLIRHDGAGNTNTHQQ